MIYFFILGRIPEVSFIEITTALTTRGVVYEIVDYSADALLIRTTTALPIERLQQQLGGTIKVGELLSEVAGYAQHTLENGCTTAVKHAAATSGRTTFGISVYTLARDHKNSSERNKKKTGPSIKEIHSLGIRIKKDLKDEGLSVRFVAPDATCTLSSVAVSKNKLTQPGGIECVIFVHEKKFSIGRTIAVQGFEDYSSRDWGRPHRSMETGLLPPKIAQVMLNLSRTLPEKKPVLLDPFCGLGTILQEALLMGYSTLYGSDVDENNVRASQENLAWLAKKYTLPFDTASIRRGDARQLHTLHAPASIDAIITEPYLGPVISHGWRGSTKDVATQLSPLYEKFFASAHTILKENGILVMVWPAWLEYARPTFLPLLSSVGAFFENCTPLSDLPAHFGNTTDRNSLLIKREGQHVARELFVFKKR